jgi:hypothetical protein
VAGIQVHAFDCPHFDQTRPEWLLAMLPCVCAEYSRARLSSRMSERPPTIEPASAPTDKES